MDTKHMEYYKLNLNHCVKIEACKSDDSSIRSPAKSSFCYVSILFNLHSLQGTLPRRYMEIFNRWLLLQGLLHQTELDPLLDRS